MLRQEFKVSLDKTRPLSEPNPNNDEHRETASDSLEAGLAGLKENRMRKKRVPEGTWFCVPLQSGGYRLGLVARSARRGGGLFGYFFRPVFREVPAASVVEGLMVSDAAGVMRFGSVQLQSGRWPVIHWDAGFMRKSWPMPEFGRRNVLTGALFACRYDDDYPFECISERRVDDIAGMPEDSVSDWVMVEWKVSELVE